MNAKLRRRLKRRSMQSGRWYMTNWLTSQGGQSDGTRLPAFPPTAIYVEWEEEVQVSRRHSRVVPRKTRIEEAYEPRKIKIGEAYELYRYSRGGWGDTDRITSVLMVTSGHHIIWHDNSASCAKPARPGIRSLVHIGPVYDFFGDEISIWSKSRPTNNLTDYMRLVQNHSVREELYHFGRSLAPKAQSEELDLEAFLNEIVEFVDRARTRS